MRRELHPLIEVTAPTQCWSCGAVQASGQPLCGACGKLVERSAGATYFELMALPVSYAIASDELDRRFRELSLKLHPDRFAQAEAKERRLALEHSTSLNEAYRTLKDPYRRAFYLLKLRGVDLGREEGGTQKEMPPEFLEEVLDLSEALEAAAGKRDIDAARELADEVAQKRQAALDQGVKALEKAPSNPSTTQEAAHQLGRVRYFNRFLEGVDALEEEILG